ncbi:VWA domain-containing protein [Rhizobium sp. LjRoot30]|uniref:nitric oxide reductase activation protein NorD n=1 Tax=Rhizobium sp. LjRoot30 TaxID=3342320 RepID=UPI003ECDA9AF
MTAVLETLLPPGWQDAWKAAHRRIDQAGYGEAVAGAYRRAGPDLAKIAGADAALRLGRTVSDLAIRCDRRTASILPEATLAAARQLRDGQAVLRWLETIEAAAKAAPRAVGALLEKTGRLLEALDLDGFRSFVRMGIAIGSRDVERQAAFFRLEDAEARRFLDRESGVDGFHVFEASLRHFLLAVWGIRPPIQEAPATTPEPMRRRCGFGGGGIRVPASFPGFAAENGNRLYRAALAHIGAHHRFTRQQFPVGSLKPLQLAVISLVEDARVERLAMREMPGLGRLWTPFHVARPGGAPVAVALLARLSRVLIDPGYDDPDGWVGKGRALFEEAFAADPADQSLSRRIGGMLGNDLGQMRLQFDAKTYVVQPAYRDDNLGIWDFGEPPPDAPVVMEEMIEGARIEQQERDDGRPDEEKQETDPEQGVSRASLAAADEEGRLAARYPEFDYITGRDRPDWCTVREYPAPAGDIGAIRRFEDRRSDLTDRLSALIRSSRISRAERVRRQPEGEFLDMDACIDATIARRIGEVPEFRVHGRYERRSRDLSVLILLDSSKSTADAVRGPTGTVLDVERLSTALLAQAMSGLGDPFAVAAFCSDSRDDIRYFRIKDFERPYDNFARARLAGIRSDLSTRLGAAIRHAGEDLRSRRSYRRVLLVITDGEPSDIDVDDRRYLIEDARAAVHTLNRAAIDTFCVALDSGAQSYAERIFGRRGAMTMTDIEQLPVRLPALFYRLTR